MLSSRNMVPLTLSLLFGASLLLAIEKRTIFRKRPHLRSLSGYRQDAPWDTGGGLSGVHGACSFSLFADRRASQSGWWK